MSSPGGFAISQPKRGALPKGDAIGEPDAPTLREVVCRDLADGPGEGRRFDARYVAWLHRCVERVVA